MNKFKTKTFFLISILCLLNVNLLSSESIENNNSNIIQQDKDKEKIEINSSGLNDYGNIVLNNKQQIKIDENLSAAVIENVFEKYKKINKELEICKIKKLKANKLYDEYYSFEFATNIKGYKQEDNNLSQRNHYFCKYGKFLDKPVEECYNFHNYQYKGVTLTRLTNVKIVFRTLIDRNDEILTFLNKNENFINTETNLDYMDETKGNLYFNYYFNKEQNKELKVGSKHIEFKVDLYKMILDSNLSFILSDSWVEMKNEVNDIANFTDIEEYMNLSENYSRMVRQFITCTNKGCSLEYQFNTNNSNHYLIKMFYEINENEKALSKIYTDLESPIKEKDMKKTKEENFNF